MRPDAIGRWRGSSQLAELLRPSLARSRIPMPYRRERVRSLALPAPVPQLAPRSLQRPIPNPGRRVEPGMVGRLPDQLAVVGLDAEVEGIRGALGRVFGRPAHPPLWLRSLWHGQ